MLKSISHSNIIKKHWNWQSKINFIDFNKFTIEVQKHGFTHCDAPSHMIKNGKSLSECNFEKLCNWATLIDVSECLGDKPITEEILEKKGSKVKEGEIIVLRSNLNDKYPNTTDKYWKNSPYLHDTGSNWLVRKKPAALVFDFPQDRAAKDLQFRIVKNQEFTEHQIILGADIMHVEHAINLRLIKKDRFYLCSLPIFLPKADGANCNPISITGLKEKKYKITDHSSIMFNNELFKSYLTLSFEKGDQVQETGFIQKGITHTCALLKNNKSREIIFNKPVFEKFVIANNINELENIGSELIFYNNELDENNFNIFIENLNCKILCIRGNLNLDKIEQILKKVEILFINIKNIHLIKKNSYIIFGSLNINDSKILPSRIISII